MEEKSKISNLMNAKVNMDFLKNMAPQMKIPKFKSRKIFNTKGPAKLDPPVISYPEPICVSRSPTRISMVSSTVSLADDGDEPNYRFGRISISAPIHRFDEPQSLKDSFDPESKSDVTKPLKLSERLSKQYKEFSEFKFKHILGKKTVVRSTNIDVANYSHRPEDVIREQTNFDFEFHSLPTANESRDYDDDDQNSLDASNSPVRPALPKRSDSTTISGKPEPNKSSLFKHIKSMSVKKKSEPESQQTDEKPKHEISDNLRKLRISKLSFNRQSFDEACVKAKTSVNNQIQKLKTLQGRSHDPGPSQHAQDIYRKKPEPGVMLAKISYGEDSERVTRSSPGRGIWPAERSRYDEPEGISHGPVLGAGYHSQGYLESLESDESDEEITGPKSIPTYPHNIKRKSRDIIFSKISYGPGNVGVIGANPPVHGLLSRNSPKGSMTAMRGDSSEESDRGCSQPLRSSSIDSESGSLRTMRPAPPIPPAKTAIPKSSQNEISMAAALLRQRKARQPSCSSREYIRSSSIESLESDCWIPDTFRGQNPNQINLSAISEDTDNGVWSSNGSKRKPKLSKPPSVDIFNAPVLAVFDDFDEALKNIPTVDVRSNEPVKEVGVKPSPKPLVEQSSIADRQENEVRHLKRSETFGKLRSRFETRSSSESSEAVADGTLHHVVVEVSTNVKSVDKEVVKQVEAVRVVDSSIAEHFATKRLLLEAIRKAPPLSAAAAVCNKTGVDYEDGDDEIFHSLDYDDGLENDMKLAYGSSTTTTKFIYTTEV